jgi:hypothetical protein
MSTPFSARDFLLSSSRTTRALCFRDHHLIGLLDQAPQFGNCHRIHALQQDPFVSPYVRCRDDPFSFGKVRKGLGVTFETNFLRNAIQAKDRENLSINLEAEIVSPLQILRSIGKTQAEFPKRINFHKTARYGRISAEISD